MKKFSLPQCDFKLFERIPPKDAKSKRTRHLRRAGNRAKVMNKINRRDDNLKIKEMVMNVKKNKRKNDQID